MPRLIICGDCGVEKSHHGLGLCKPCYMRRWRKENPGRVYRYPQTGKQREARRQYNRRWREEHKEELRAYHRRWYQEHKAEQKIKDALYARAHRKEQALSNRRYRARRRCLATTLTVEQAEQILSSGQCFYCGEGFLPGELALDHFVPLIKGGGTTRANMVPSCRGCNSSKATKMPEEILTQLELSERGQYRCTT